MTQEKPNEPSNNPVNGDPFFDELARQSEEAFKRHAYGHMEDARTELANAEREGDSRRAEKAAGSLSRLAIGVDHSDRIIDAIDSLDISVTDNSEPAVAIDVHHEVQYNPEAHAA